MNKTTKASINGKEVLLEIPNNPYIGLSKHKTLCEECGMLFYFPNLNPSITMKDTTLSLDILFIDKDIITDIVSVKGGYKDLIQGEGDKVIELNKGFCKKNNIKIGDTVLFNNYNSKLKSMKDSKLTQKEAEEIGLYQSTVDGLNNNYKPQLIKRQIGNRVDDRAMNSVQKASDLFIGQKDKDLIQRANKAIRNDIARNISSLQYGGKTEDSDTSMKAVIEALKPSQEEMEEFKIALTQTYNEEQLKQFTKKDLANLFSTFIKKKRATKQAYEYPQPSTYKQGGKILNKALEKVESASKEQPKGSIEKEGKENYDYFTRKDYKRDGDTKILENNKDILGLLKRTNLPEFSVYMKSKYSEIQLRNLSENTITKEYNNFIKLKKNGKALVKDLIKNNIPVQERYSKGGIIQHIGGSLNADSAVLNWKFANTKKEVDSLKKKYLSKKTNKAIKKAEKDLDIKYKEGGMFLLDHEGKPQMKMFGGERIVSRKETKQLIELIKKGNDKDNLVKIGKFMVEVITKQDNREPEYVEED